MKFMSHKRYPPPVLKDFHNHTVRLWIVRDLSAHKQIALVSMEAIFRVQQPTQLSATVPLLIRLRALIPQQLMLNYLKLIAPQIVKNNALHLHAVELIVRRANALRFVITHLNVFHHPALSVTVR